MFRFAKRKAVIYKSWLSLFLQLWLLGASGFITGEKAFAQSKILPDDTLVGAEKSHIVTTSDLVDVSGSGVSSTNLFGLGQYTRASSLSTEATSVKDAGDLTINTGQLIVRDGAEVSAKTEGLGNGGGIQVHANSVSLTNGAVLTSRSEGQGRAGNLNINLRDTLQTNNGTISTNATSAGGGNIAINAKDIRLRNNSDIRTNSGGGDGGNIFLTANTIIALENSDILAFAPLGRGGNIKFTTSAFLSDPLYRPAPATTDAATLNGLDKNGRVDVNASGAISGAVIGIPDITFLQNSLTELQQQPIDANALIANSCIARSNKQEGSFTITGSGGLPNRPGDASVSSYPTGTVQSVQGDRTSRPWQKGDPIVEPQGVYQLPNGHLVLSRECL